MCLCHSCTHKLNWLSVWPHRFFTLDRCSCPMLTRIVCTKSCTEHGTSTSCVCDVWALFSHSALVSRAPVGSVWRDVVSSAHKSMAAPPAAIPARLLEPPPSNALTGFVIPCLPIRCQALLINLYIPFFLIDNIQSLASASLDKTIICACKARPIGPSCGTRRRNVTFAVMGFVHVCDQEGRLKGNVVTAAPVSKLNFTKMNAQCLLIPQILGSNGSMKRTTRPLRRIKRTQVQVILSHLRVHPLVQRHPSIQLALAFNCGVPR